MLDSNFFSAVAEGKLKNRKSGKISVSDEHSKGPGLTLRAKMNIHERPSTAPHFFLSWDAFWCRLSDNFNLALTEKDLSDYIIGEIIF